MRNDSVFLALVGPGDHHAQHPAICLLNQALEALTGLGPPAASARLSVVAALEGATKGKTGIMRQQAAHFRRLRRVHFARARRIHRGLEPANRRTPDDLRISARVEHWAAWVLDAYAAELDKPTPVLDWTEVEATLGILPAGTKLGIFDATVQGMVLRVERWAADEDAPVQWVGRLAGCPASEPFDTPEEAQVAAEALARQRFTEHLERAQAGLAALSGHGNWFPGMKVTVCSDEARERPRRVTDVARLARHGFRLLGTGDWYDWMGCRTTETKQEHEGRCFRCGQVPIEHGPFVRPYRDGDEAAVERETARLAAEAAREGRIRLLRRDCEQARREVGATPSDVIRWREKKNDAEKTLATATARLAHHDATVASARERLAALEAELAKLEKL